MTKGKFKKALMEAAAWDKQLTAEERWIPWQHGRQAVVDRICEKYYPKDLKKEKQDES